MGKLFPHILNLQIYQYSYIYIFIICAEVDTEQQQFEFKVASFIGCTLISTGRLVLGEKPNCKDFCSM